MNPPLSAGLSQEEMMQVAPQKDNSEPIKVSLKYEDLPIDSKAQVLEKAGFPSDPRILEAEEMSNSKMKKDEKEANVLKMLADSHAIMNRKETSDGSPPAEKINNKK